jgi:hypothetical protein
MMSSLVGCIEPHARLPGSLVVQAETLGLGGELISDRLPVSVVDAFVGEQVGQQDAATVADAPVRELAFTRYGRETFKMSAACWVVSSAWTGATVTALPLAIWARTSTSSRRAWPGICRVGPESSALSERAMPARLGSLVESPT